MKFPRRTNASFSRQRRFHVAAVGMVESYVVETGGAMAESRDHCFRSSQSDNATSKLDDSQEQLLKTTTATHDGTRSMQVSSKHKCLPTSHRWCASLIFSAFC